MSTEKIPLMRITHIGDPILRTVSSETSPDQIREIVPPMLRTLLLSDGVGLAAVQCGYAVRMFMTKVPGDAARIFINPTIETEGDPILYAEGCLSIPGFTAEIRRPKNVTIKATGIDGKPIHQFVKGYLARVIQHEYDHLEGIMAVDRITAKSRREIAPSANKRTIKSVVMAEDTYSNLASHYTNKGLSYAERDIDR